MAGFKTRKKDGQIFPVGSGKEYKREDDYSKGVTGSNQLVGHNSPDTAYVVHDYPYGRYRTDMRYWIESTKRGDRFCRQSLNPKTGKWNMPKKSTYSDVMVLTKDPKTGYVTTDSISGYDNEKKASEFSSKYQLNDTQKKSVKMLIAMDRGQKHYTWKISKDGESEQTQEEQRDIIRKSTIYELAKMGKEEKT